MASTAPTVTPEPAVAFAGWGAVWLCGAVASSIPIALAGHRDGDTPIPLLAASLLAGWATMLVGVVVVSRRVGSGDARRDVGLTARSIDLVGLVFGALTQIALVPLVYLPLQALWPDTFGDDRLAETAKDLVDRADGAQIVLLFVLIALGAPLVEEIVYRGLLQRPLLAAGRPIVVVVGVAALFALIHFRPVEYPGLFVAGLVFGICAWRTDRLGMAIAAHVGFNIAGLVLAL